MNTAPEDPLPAALAAVRAATLRRLLHRLGARVTPGTTLLDVGAGSGAETPLFRALGFTPTRIVGIDPDLARLRTRAHVPPGTDSESASGRVRRPGPSVLGLGERLPFRECAFDAVIAITLLSSVPEPGTRRAIVREMLRVARPGGVVVVFDLRRLRPGGRARVAIDLREMRRLFDPERPAIETMSAFPQGLRALAAVGLPADRAAGLLETFSPFPMFLAAGVRKTRF